LAMSEKTEVWKFLSQSRLGGRAGPKKVLTKATWSWF
jgi:hypothetical protein